MSHETGHGYKPFANPLGIFVGLLILWAVSGGLVWVLIKAFSGGGEAAG